MRKVIRPGAKLYIDCLSSAALGRLKNEAGRTAF